LAGYFRFALRFFLVVFFFDVLRAPFFAAILRTVVLFFLLFGMKRLPLQFEEGRSMRPPKTARI
jgi:hypothetical protein